MRLFLLPSILKQGNILANFLFGEKSGQKGFKFSLPLTSPGIYPYFNLQNARFCGDYSYCCKLSIGMPQSSDITPISSNMQISRLIPDSDKLPSHFLNIHVATIEICKDFFIGNSIKAGCSLSGGRIHEYCIWRNQKNNNTL